VQQVINSYYFKLAILLRISTAYTCPATVAELYHIFAIKFSMKIIVTGGTGMAGAEVVRQAIADSGITTVIAITRKALEIKHPKIIELVLKDFLDYQAIIPLLAGADACIWCLGISQLQVSKQQYELITFDYTVAGAKAMLNANPSMSFVFVSGDGADPSGKSRTLFARVKGKAEKELQQLGFSKLVIARPGGIRPVHKNKNSPLAYKLLNPFYPLLEILIPSKVINSVQLAKALIYAAKKQTDKTVLENADLKEIANRC
jgi:uncharacterized protein YbjT (DUF2867 family)